MELPQTLKFLNLGFWVIHTFAITIIFTLGYAMGKKKARKLSTDFQRMKTDSVKVDKSPGR